MSTVVDYADRLSDVSAFQGWELGVGHEVLLEQAIASEVSPGGEAITGIVKLCQRFLILLFTQAGSLTHLPDSGCRFMIDAVSGRWRTSADVQQSFYSALLDIKRQLRQMETPDDPDDERLTDARIVNIVLSPQDRAVIRVALTTQAGTSRQFLAPISVTPR